MNEMTEREERLLFSESFHPVQVKFSVDQHLSCLNDLRSAWTSHTYI